MKFNLGQRVCRLSNVFVPDSLMFYGEVVEQYSSAEHEELYAVQWDEGRLERGFLPHGLQKEPHS